MREPLFIQSNTKKWASFENILQNNENSPDLFAKLYISITDDLAFASTHYPNSPTTIYLNELAIKVYSKIYKNKREKSNRFIHFWKIELPLLMSTCQKELLYSFLIFSGFVLVGIFSTEIDDSFVRLILGDHYVNMTLENIKNGDPMAVYKSSREIDMFLGITINNIRVSFYAFMMGLLASWGTVYILMKNGIMLGAFQYFFYQKNLLFSSMLTIWIHGSLEIPAIVIAGCAGLVMGNSILFPGTYSRIHSFSTGAMKGMKIVIGLIPIFIVAGFLESYVTRLTELPVFLKLTIIISSWAFIILYFVYYPIRLKTKLNNIDYKGSL